MNVYCNFRSKKCIALYKTCVATALVTKAELFQLLVSFRLIFVHKILCKGNIEEFLTCFEIFRYQTVVVDVDLSTKVCLNIAVCSSLGREAYSGSAKYIMKEIA